MDSLFNLFWARSANSLPAINGSASASPSTSNALPPPNVEERAMSSIQRLQDNKQAYLIRAKELEKTIQNETTVWKTLYAQGKQREASIVFQRSKNSGKELQNILIRINNIDTQISSVKQSSLDVDNVAAYQEANKYRTEVQSYMDAQRVDDITEESRQQLNEQVQIQEALNNPLDPEAANADPDDLKAMMAEEFGPTQEELSLLSAPLASMRDPGSENGQQQQNFTPYMQQQQPQQRRPVGLGSAANQNIPNNPSYQGSVVTAAAPNGSGAATYQNTLYQQQYTMQTPHAGRQAPPVVTNQSSNQGGRRLKNIEAIVNVNI